MNYNFVFSVLEVVGGENVHGDAMKGYWDPKKVGTCREFLTWFHILR